MSDFNDLATKLKEEAIECDSFYTYTARLLREAADAIDLLLRLNEKHENLIEQKLEIIKEKDMEIEELQKSVRYLLVIEKQFNDMRSIT